MADEKKNKRHWSLRAEFIGVAKFARSGDSEEETKKVFEEEIQEYLEDENFILIPASHPAAGLASVIGKGSGILKMKRVSLSPGATKILKELPPEDDDDDDDDKGDKPTSSKGDDPDCEGCPNKTRCPGKENCGDRDAPPKKGMN